MVFWGVLGWGVTVSAAPPANDPFSSPLVISGYPVSGLSSNVGATLEVGEPDPENYIGDVQASVWFRWTSPTSGPVRIDTLDSDFDTVLAVWTGTAVNALTMLADNDQYGGDQSAVFLAAVSGVTYQIAVYGWYEQRGSIRLTVTNDTSSQIAGVVTGPDQVTPLEGIQVRAYRDTGFGWSTENTSTTLADGSYVISGLSADTYRVRFRDLSDEYLREFYDDKSDLDSATDVVVPVLTQVTGIDAALSEASKISGTVTGPDGVTPAVDIEVTAYAWDGFSWNYNSSAYTDGSGQYTVGNLTAGTYRVGFADSSTAQLYLSEYYQDAASLAAAADIAVAGTSTVSGINAQLGLASRISGAVTGLDGVTPLFNIRALAYFWNGSGWDSQAAGQTDGAGLYTIGGLTAGTYRVQFVDYSGRYLNEVYDDQATLDAGQDVVVPGTATVTDIDASLGEASSIQGTVTGPDGSTPVEGAFVSAWINAGFSWIPSGSGSSTDENGNYTVGGLAPGTYRVQFNAGFQGYAAEFYNDASDVISATDIVAPATTTVTGIDASLSAGASISGTVTGPDGLTPLADIFVTAYIGGNGYGASTDSSGSYTIGGLAAGTYQVEFRDPSGNHVTEYYLDIPDFNSALDVVLTEGAAVSGINASLTLAGRISGQVYGPDGFSAATGIQVVAYAWTGSFWSWVNSGDSDAAGAYSLGGLSAGTYRVQFSDANAGDYISQVYSNATDLSGGLDVVVSEGTEVTGIDAVLQAAARIQGRVTRRDGVTVPNNTILIYAYRWNGVDYDYTANTSMQADGTYVLGGLAGDTYRLYFAPLFGMGYQGAYYTNSPTINTGTDIVVAAGEIRTGVDMSLTAFSRILGRITRGDGITPVEGITASAYRWNGMGWDWVTAGSSDTGGYYAVNQLYAGTYRVQFVDGGSQYAGEVYDNVGGLEAGLDVVAPEDGDAVNIDAWLGLDVNMASAQPTVIGLQAKPGGGWNVRFTAVSGLLYRVRSTSGLTNGWLDHTAPMISQGGTNTFSVTGGTARTFFSILAEP
jgi:hypothetical protein